jgi:hypothetical protein
MHGATTKIDWQLFTEVLGQAVQEDCLALEDGTDGLSRIVGKQLPICAA